MVRINRSIVISVICMFCFVNITFAQGDLSTGIEAYQSGNYSQCIENMKMIVKDDPTSVVGYYYLALSYTMTGQELLAVQNYNKVINLNSDSTLTKLARQGKATINNSSKIENQLRDITEDIKETVEEEYNPILQDGSVRESSKDIPEKTVPIQAKTTQVIKASDYKGVSPKPNNNTPNAQPTNDDIVNAIPPRKNSRVASKLFYRVYNHFSESEYELCTERFSIISRRAVNRVTTYSKVIPYRKAVYTSSGLRCCNIEYSPVQNYKGQVYSDIDNSNKATDALILFTNVAYKVSLTFSIIMLIFMFVAALYTVVAYFGFNKPVEGWAPLMGLISVGFFATFLLITMVMKYLDVLLRLVFKNQKYLVASIEKL